MEQEKDLPTNESSEPKEPFQNKKKTSWKKIREAIRSFFLSGKGTYRDVYQESEEDN